MSKLIVWGEKIRENLKTLWLSVPFFVLGICLFSLIGDRDNLSRAWGHLGIVFKNAYRHKSPRRAYLKSALFSFKKALKGAAIEDSVGVRMTIAQTLSLLDDHEAALRTIQEAVFQARQVSPAGALLGRVLVHQAQIQIAAGELKAGHQSLKEGWKYLEEALEKEPQDFHLQVWYTGAQLDWANYYRAVDKIEKSREWAQHALEDSRRWNLSFREHDARRILETP
ncbi:hypothetical protein L6258_00580 [Candidatus Parcubacteria bacterium]|nr:hypothetical protein [Candidatus Parcubacteria bacterium]